MCACSYDAGNGCFKLDAMENWVGLDCVEKWRRILDFRWAVLSVVYFHFHFTKVKLNVSQ